MSARLELYVGKKRVIGLLLLTCVMVGASYFCTTLPGLKPLIFGWIGMCFFGLGFFVIPRQLVQSGAQFVIDERGIEDRRQKFGVVEWSDIISLSVAKIHGQRLLCMEVVEPEKYLSRLSKAGRMGAQANRGLGFSEITLALNGLSRPADEIWKFIQGNYGIGKKQV